tara:strand:+ start:2137 stop:4764 length:2628 start_codon:yes stop_codon:yes gene_type:complete
MKIKKEIVLIYGTIPFIFILITVITVTGGSGNTTQFWDNTTIQLGDVSKNIWWRDLDISDTINAETKIIIPHFIDYDNILSNTTYIVEPIKIMYKNGTVLDYGYNFTSGGNTRLGQFNETDFFWEPSIGLASGDEFRIQFGKRLEMRGGVSSIFTPESSYIQNNRTILFNVSKIPDVVNVTLYGYNFTESETFGVDSTSCTNPGDCNGAVCQGGSSDYQSVSACDFTQCDVQVAVTGTTYRVYLASGGSGTCEWTGQVESGCSVSTKSASWSGASGSIGSYSGYCESHFTHAFGAAGTCSVNSYNSGGSLSGVTVTYAPKNLNLTVGSTIYATNGSSANTDGWLFSNDRLVTSSDFVGEVSLGENYLNVTTETDGIAFVAFDYQTENTPPDIISNITIPTTPAFGDTLYINANITDPEGDNVIWTNFTILYPNGTIMMDAINGTKDDVWATGSTNWTSTPGLIIDDAGTYNWYVNASDESGDQVSDSGLFTITDSTAPTIVAVDSPVNNSDYLTSSIDVNYTVTDGVRVDTVWYNIINITGEILTSNVSGNYCGDTTCATNFSQVSFPIETMILNVYANDTSNNQVLERVNLSSSLDTSPPDATIIEPVGNETDFTVQIRYNVTDNVAVDSCSWNITKLSENYSIIDSADNYGCNIFTSYPLNSLAQTDFVFTMETNDTNGNVEQYSSNFNVEIPPPPSITITGGGGGGVSFRNITSILHFSRPFISFTLFRGTPASDLVKVFITNQGDDEIQGDITIPESLHPYINAEICDLITEDCKRFITLPKGETAMILLRMQVSEDFPQEGVEGIIQIKDEISDEIHELPIGIHYPFGWGLVSGLSDLTGLSEKTSSAITALGSLSMVFLGFGLKLGGYI